MKELLHEKAKSYGDNLTYGKIVKDLLEDNTLIEILITRGILIEIDPTQYHSKLTNSIVNNFEYAIENNKSNYLKELLLMEEPTVNLYIKKRGLRELQLILIKSKR